jgi:hypothetical protein
MTDFRRLPRPALVDFANNSATGVANGKITGFNPAQNTSVSDALTDAAAELATAEMNAVTTRAAALEAMALAQEKAAVVVKLLSELKFGLRSVDAPADQYDALGFTPPDTIRTVVIPMTPSGLEAAGFSNGTNQLTWKGNNISGSVTYGIEVKIGDTAPYVLLATTTKQSYKHVGVTPGQFYQYRVRAQASRNQISDWSNEAVVYGSQPDLGE